MANKGKPQTTAVKEQSPAVSRSKRSSFERKCLSKSFKRIFAGMGRQVFKVVLKAEQQSRKKKSKTAVKEEASE